MPAIKRLSCRSCREASEDTEVNTTELQVATQFPDVGNCGFLDFPPSVSRHSQCNGLGRIWRRQLSLAWCRKWRYDLLGKSFGQQRPQGIVYLMANLEPFLQLQLDEAAIPQIRRSSAMCS